MSNKEILELTKTNIDLKPEEHLDNSNVVNELRLHIMSLMLRIGRLEVELEKLKSKNSKS